MLRKKYSGNKGCETSIAVRDEAGRHMKRSTRQDDANIYKYLGPQRRRLDGITDSMDWGFVTQHIATAMFSFPLKEL